MPFVPVESAVRAVVIANAGVLALISTRVYPEKLPQNPTLPASIYTVLSDIPFDDISGQAGLYRAIVEFESIAKTKAEASSIEDAIRLSLQAYRGTKLGVNILGVHHLQTHSDFEGEIAEFKMISRFGVFYNRANPSHS